MVINVNGKSVFIVGLSLLLAGTIYGEVQACSWCGDEEYYCMDCNNRRLGGYGARKSVTSIEDARKELKEQYAGSNLMVGKVVEKSSYYEAEILDKSKRLIDKVIIHKQSGRIRSVK